MIMVLHGTMQGYVLRQNFNAETALATVEIPDDLALDDYVVWNKYRPEKKHSDYYLHKKNIKSIAISDSDIKLNVIKYHRFDTY